MFIKLVLADSLKPLHPQVHFPTSVPRKREPRPLLKARCGVVTPLDSRFRGNDGLPLGRETVRVFSYLRSH